MGNNESKRILNTHPYSIMQYAANPFKIVYKKESYSNLKIKSLTSMKPMEAAILDIEFPSGIFWIANEIPNYVYIANFTECFLKVNYFQQKNQ